MLALGLVLAAAAAAQPHEHHPEPTRSYARTTAAYEVPDVVLTDMSGAERKLGEVLDHEGPLVLQFIFTTCPGVCPMLSAVFQGAQDELPAAARLVSISIDPEHDTPERLRAYAERFRAGPRWLFLTGALDDVVAVEKAFDAYRGNKMRHEPLTFLRERDGEHWVRLAGFLQASELVREVYRIDGDPKLGERIYQEGILPSGEPLSAVAAGDVAVAGVAFACASCHRRSGFGSVEGAAFVPPVTAPALFRPREPSRAELFRKLYQEVQPVPFAARVRDPRVRPAYDRETLAAALSRGRDPSGRLLEPWMPRYLLGEDDLAHLAAYLETLRRAPDPGVDGERIHFATVVTEGVDPEERAALIAVARAYVARKNHDTRNLLARPGHSPWHRDDFVDAYREWVLHEWELTGPASSWRAQLEAAYEGKPVFAVLGGLGAGDWRPVHDFCEARRLPCLFPQTGLPAPEPGAYSLYFSRGVVGEAAALGRHLETLAQDGDREVRVVQRTGASEESKAAARALSEALEGREGVRLEGETAADADVWVLWLGASQWREAAERIPGEAPIVLSGSLLGEMPEVGGKLRERLLLTWPYALPGTEVPRIYRVRAWLRSRGLERTAERVQLGTYFAFSVAEHALDHLVESFSRDYFVEEVEHETENALNPGVYPRLTLGPGQRFASKGSFIVAVGEAGELIAKSPWIVP